MPKKVEKQVVKKISELFIPHFWDFMNDLGDVNVLWGSRGGGKSFNVAQATALYIATTKNYFCGLVLRKNFNKVFGSLVQDFYEACMNLGINDYTKKTKTPMEIKFPNGNSVFFMGLSATAGIRGAKEAGKKFSHLIVDEAQYATELEVNDAVETAFRSQDIGHLIIIQNTGVRDWTYDKYAKPANFEPNEVELEEKGFMYKKYIDEAKGINWRLMYSSKYGNPHLKKKDIDSIKFKKLNDPESYRIDVLGMWGDVAGQIYLHYQKFIQFITAEELIKKIDAGEVDEFVFAVDYGETNSATTCWCGAFSKDYKQVYHINLYYHHNLTMHVKNATEMKNDIVQFIGQNVRKYKMLDFTLICDSAANVFGTTIQQQLELYKYNFWYTPSLTEKGNPGKIEIDKRITLDKTLFSEGRQFYVEGGNWEPHFDEMHRSTWVETQTGQSTKLKRIDKWNDTLDPKEYAITFRMISLNAASEKEL